MRANDTSWPGYEEVPRWVIDGYSTILWEIDDELVNLGEEDPRLVVQHYRQPGRDPNLSILSVEPARAACMQASIEAGRIVSVPGPHVSIMAGLNCGRPPMLAWPIVSAGVDACISIDDEPAREAMRALARGGVVAGETGAAGLGGLLELLTGPASDLHRKHLHVDETTRMLLFITEGATDPQAYANIIG